MMKSFKQELFDYSFILGDLNYRIDIDNYEETVKLIENKEFSKLI